MRFFVAVSLSILLGASACRERKGTPAAADAADAADAASSGAPIRAQTSSRAANATLLVAISRFEQQGGQMRALAAHLMLLRETAAGWTTQTLRDESSNVFHKALPWRNGILTIGGSKAILRHWRCEKGRWAPRTLWERSWGGKFDRLRDLELGDVDGDGQEELVLATHDQGVVAIGDEHGSDWRFTELGRTPDTFVHEIELGDVDGDGVPEIYATPSLRNKATFESQSGKVVQYRHTPKGYAQTVLIEWDSSHAKEILVTDLDGNGRADLLAVREAQTKRRNQRTEVIDPVRIFHLVPGRQGKWTPLEIAHFDDRQMRFVATGNIDGDDQKDLVAAGMTSGLWWLERSEDGRFRSELIDDESGGFEHAIHLADLDGDGRDEIYVASDRHGELRRYAYEGDEFEEELLHPIEKGALTWSITHGDMHCP